MIAKKNLSSKLGHSVDTVWGIFFQKKKNSSEVTEKNLFLGNKYKIQFFKEKDLFIHVEKETFNLSRKKAMFI